VIKKIDLRVQPEDCTGEHTNYFFVEADDSFAFTIGNSTRLDTFGYDTLVLDFDTTISTAGLTFIYPTDEARWFTFSDIDQINYFQMNVIAEQLITPTAIGNNIIIRNSKGEPVRADCFEIYDDDIIGNENGFDFSPFDDYDSYDEADINSFQGAQPYQENGEYIYASYPLQSTSPSFKRVNHSTIQILNRGLTGKTFRVVAYGPPDKQVSPNILIDHVNDVIKRDDIIWWDPARGNHHPDAARSIDLDGNEDPARYTHSLCEYKNINKQNLRPWGVNEVGTVWWNTEQLYWMPYSDDKLHPSLIDRQAMWGAVSDASTINVYEWIKSGVPPVEAPTGESYTGEPAINNYIRRDRTWYQRPIAWKHSINPARIARKFLAYQPQSIQMRDNGNATSRLTIETKSFKEYGIINGSKISAATYNSLAKDDSTLNGISGQVQVITDPYVVVGPVIDGSSIRLCDPIDDVFDYDNTQNDSRIYDSGAYFAFEEYWNEIGFDNINLSDIIEGVTVAVDDNTLKLRQDYLGRYSLGSFELCDNYSCPGTTPTTGPTMPTFVTLDREFLNTNFTVPGLVGSIVVDPIPVTVTVKHSFLTLTHESTGETQSVEIVAPTTGVAGQSMEFNFDKLGIKITAKLYGCARYNDCETTGYIDNLVPAGAGFAPLSYPTKISVQNQIRSLLANKNNQIFLREAVDVFVPINLLNGRSTTDPVVVQHDDWIAWNDPLTNPVDGLTPPFNNHEPFLGEWAPVGPFLQDLSDDIAAKLIENSTWFDGTSIAPYKSSWTRWKELKTVIKTVNFFSVNDLNGFSFDNFEKRPLIELHDRVSVFINEKQLKPLHWSITVSPTIETIFNVNIEIQQVNNGDTVRVKVKPYAPLKADLEFDPSITDDPYRMMQYKQDYPYVKEILRDSFDNPSVINYYYWVKNKTSPPSSEKLPIKQTSQLLHAHDKIYAMPQHVKFRTINGRPNRYAILSLKGLGLEVKGQNFNKLRINYNPTLRDRDLNISLKPVHEEWILLSPGQPNKIPRSLWDLLIETLTATTILNQQLPFIFYSSYDRRHDTSVRYGFDRGQIFSDQGSTIVTVKHMILNPKITKYENGKLIPDYIVYPGFDINQLNDHFSSTEQIRRFMTDLWRFASAAQINEIFFAVLLDAAAKNKEMTKLFKTSFISLNDVSVETIT